MLFGILINFGYFVRLQLLFVSWQHFSNELFQENCEKKRKKIVMFLYSFKNTVCLVADYVPFSLLTFQWDGFLYFSIKRVLWGVAMRGQGIFTFSTLRLPPVLLPKDRFLECGPSVCPLLWLLSEARLVRRTLLPFLHKLALQGHELTIRQWIFLVLPDNCLLGSL